MNAIRDAIFNKIKKGEVKMKPKIFFVLKTTMAILAVFAVALVILYLISFIVFAMRASGAWFLPGFGFMGIKIFAGALPWLLIIIAVILIAVLEILVKYFSFAYRRPLLYSLLGIIIIALIGSFIVDRARIHPGLFSRARENRLPIAGPFYRGYGMPSLRNAHQGIVSGVTENGFAMKDINGDMVTVIITPQTRVSPDTDIRENSKVIVLGEIKNGTIEAAGIREIDIGNEFFPSRRMPGKDIRPFMK